MKRRSITIPEDLEARIEDSGTIRDSFSAFAREALREHLKRVERDDDDDESPPDA